jgi:isorenieratene synthase
VIANRLDPWHGVHFHPQVFAHLEVMQATPQRLDLRVQYRLLGRVVIEVDATFHCPEPRTIVMTIVQGEGEGSTVETHATPITRGRTAVIESTFATSERRAFQLILRVARVVRPYIAYTARGLWKQDAAYAERLYALRRGALNWHWRDETGAPPLLREDGNLNAFDGCSPQCKDETIVD